MFWSRVDSFFQPRERLVAAGIAILAGIAVYAVAGTVFEFHSNNHDEAVYLQQAELLLDGRFILDPGQFGDAVRPWFFFETDQGFVPKYQPLPAGLYAIAIGIFGEPRIALAAIAAGNTALVYVLGAQVFDRRVGLVAALAFATAPMTMATTSVFLPYAPTTLCNLAFATAYLRSVRRRHIGYAAIAGVSIGLAFFMRPYTALLFALPFIGHALLQLGRGVRDYGIPEHLTAVPEPFVRHSVTAAFGLVFVVLTLLYNLQVTGDLLQFPYQAFAPNDGPGFGHRELLSHSIDYTPVVAIEANAHVLWYFLTRWGPAGVLGTLVAFIGFLGTGPHIRRVVGALVPGDYFDDESLPVLDHDSTSRTLLAGLFVTIPLGNIYFWGNNNILADWSDPTDGFISLFGPFYHFDLLAPLSIFVGAGLVFLWRSRGHLLDWAENHRPSHQRPIRILSVVLAVALVVAMVATSAAFVATALDRNQAHTETFEQAYSPFEEHEFENALVFMPTPYGDWLNHPFQYLRNDGDLDGPIVYVLDGDPEQQFAMLDAEPERTPYRYRFRGEYVPDPAEREVNPVLAQLDVRDATRFQGTTTVGVPDGVTHASVRLEVDDQTTGYTLRTVDEEITVQYEMDRDEVTLLQSTNATSENASALVRHGGVPVDDAEEVVLLVRLVQSEGQTLTYRQEVSVRQTVRGLQVIWPPERTVCPIVDRCGYEGTYIPDEPEQPVDGVFFDVALHEYSGN